MVRLYHKLYELDFAGLMQIYIEANRENGSELYSEESASMQLALAEQDFYAYLHDVFFKIPGAVYAVCEEAGLYVSALRLEPYEDGLLLEALETRPDMRRKGYAKKLICEVLRTLPEGKNVPVYSHVHKKNVPSIRTHESCGFRKIKDYAVYVDGTVSSWTVTMCYKQ